MKTKNYKLIIMSILSITMITFLFHVTDSSAKPNVIKVVALGDSITFGTGDPMKKGYIVRFKEKFSKYQSSPVIVNNFAIPKYITNQTLEQLKSKKVQKSIERSDYIILNIGTNDFRKSAKHSFNQINLVDFKEGQAVYTKNLNQILSELRKTNTSAPIFVFGLYDAYEDHENSKQLNELIINWNKDIQSVIETFEHVTYVPTLDIFESKPKEEYFSDSLHPNPKGYEKLANRLLQKIMLAENKNKE